MKFKVSTRVRMAFALALVAGFVGLTLSVSPGAASADSGGNVNVTFTKWITTWPDMAGVVGGDVGAGTFAGEVLSYDPTFADGQMTKIVADYHIIAGAQSFTAHLQITDSNRTGIAVANGVVTAGGLIGAQVHGGFVTIPCPDPYASHGTCFQGTLRVMAGSAN